MIYEHAVNARAAAVHERFADQLCPPGYMLAGGTALALHLGHRESDDLDFMTPMPPDLSKVVQRLEEAIPGLALTDRSEFSVHGLIDDVRVSYLWQRGVRLEVGGHWGSTPIASVPTLTALKCNAIAGRGSKRDFIDVYALLQSGVSFDEVLETASTYAPSLNRSHLLRACLYFEDADKEPMPRLYHDWAWDDVKSTFRAVVPAYMRRHLPDLPERSDPPTRGLSR